MKFAVCMPQGRRIALQEFEKEYNQVSTGVFSLIPGENTEEHLAACDFIDMVVPAQDVLYYRKTFPPVNRDKLMDIVRQDVETETAFSSDDVILQPMTDGRVTTVMIVPRETLGRLTNVIGAANREKIRSFIPEEALFFTDDNAADTALFVGANHSVFVSPEGQVVHNEGARSIIDVAREIFAPSEDDAAFERWCSSMADLSIDEGLSEDEVRLRKKILRFADNLRQRFDLFVTQETTTDVFFSYPIPGNGHQLFAQSSWTLRDETVRGPEEMLRSMETIAADGTLNFARGEFAYRGGFGFLKKRIILTCILCLAAYVFMFIAMELRLGDLEDESSQITEKAKKMSRKVLGKDLPSLRQALSIMKKAVNDGEDDPGEKRLYPFSALYIMEDVFPLTAFKKSSIEVDNIYMKKNGEVRLTGYSDTLEDINTAMQNLDEHANITDINKGQINSRRGRNAFSVSFKFLPERECRDSSEKK